MDDELESPRELPFPDSAEELLAMPGTLLAVPLSTDTPGGWYPAAIRRSSPNFWKGHVGPRAAAVAHVTDAAWPSVVSWFRNPASERSAHFQVRKSGIVDQFVSVEDSAWANGASWQGDHWIDPQGHAIRPTWPAMAADHTNPNRRTISIEHEGRPSEPWTAEQTEADTRLLRWLASQFASLSPYRAGLTLIRHAAISPVSKPNCPGPLVDLSERAAAANGTLPPPPIGHYRALAPMWISETPGPRGPVALGGAAIVAANDILDIDEVRPDGWAHLRSAVGFLPIGGLKKL
jgi:N-acetylmuramoyl-L-alanine amidase-like protein